MATSPLQAFPTPELSDLVGAWPSASLAQMSAVEKQTAMIFSTANVRDAAVTSPSAGMVAYLTTPKQYTWYDGSAWHGEWASYTPTDTNITVGDGTRTAQWRWGIDGMVDFHWRLTFGSTTSIGGSAAIGLPRALISLAGIVQVFPAWYLDNAARHYIGSALPASGASTASLLHTETGNLGIVNATNPFTWTSVDEIGVQGRYRPA